MRLCQCPFPPTKTEPAAVGQLRRRDKGEDVADSGKVKAVASTYGRLTRALIQ